MEGQFPATPERLFDAEDSWAGIESSGAAPDRPAGGNGVEDNDPDPQSR